MGSGNTWADEILNILRNTAPSARNGAYISLHTADPGATGASEVSGGSYARVQITAAQLDAPAGSAGARAIASNVEKAFAAATADWGTITHVGIFDASTAGNFLAGGALTASQAVDSGVTASFPSGSFSVKQT